MTQANLYLRWMAVHNATLIALKEAELEAKTIHLTDDQYRRVLALLAKGNSDHA